MRHRRRLTAHAGLVRRFQVEKGLAVFPLAAVVSCGLPAMPGPGVVAAFALLLLALLLLSLALVALDEAGRRGRRQRRWRRRAG